MEFEGPQTDNISRETVRSRPELPRGQEEPTYGECSAIGVKPRDSPPTESSNNAEKAERGRVRHGPQLLKHQEISPEGNIHLWAILSLQETRAAPAKWPPARVLPVFSLPALFPFFVF